MSIITSILFLDDIGPRIGMQGFSPAANPFVRLVHRVQRPASQTMTDTTQLAATANQTTTSPIHPSAHWTDQIDGRFRRITVRQMFLAWWLYREGEITMRQLRIYFAAHEMAERRRYTRNADDGKARRPHYGTDEVRRLIGGQSTDSARAALEADLKHLARLGLVAVSTRAIHFAVDADGVQIRSRAIYDEVLAKIPNNRRSIPVPRRTLRALAGGFGRATTGVMIALMIRSLYWHRQTAARAGGYRTDGRTKGSWIADVFAISRRGVTEGRKSLVELGWLEPIETPQWQLNKWGQHDRIRVDWMLLEEGPPAGESASPPHENAAENASPCLNRSTPSSKEDLETRKPAPMRPDPSGDCLQGEGKEGSAPPQARSASINPAPPGRHSITPTQRPTSYTSASQGKPTRAGKGTDDPNGPPKLTDIQSADLRNTDRLLHLYRQAVVCGWAADSEAGQLDFLALAERARSRGQNPAKLFAWLLRHNRRDFITQSDEDAAANRLREHRNGPTNRQHATGGAEKRDTQWSDVDRKVKACIDVAKQQGPQPALIALHAWGWTEEQWIENRDHFEDKQRTSWYCAAL